MTKNKISSIVAFMLCLSSVCAYGQRNISWLHGLGGNSITWDQMEDIFEIERLEITPSSTFSPGYQSQLGVSAASNDIVINGKIPFDNNGIIIGHSMGGIVARNIDHINTGQFGGIITVGSPNLGAAISNSLDNGDVDDAFNFACDELLAGPLSEPPIFALPIIGGFAADQICDVLNDELILPELVGQNNQSAIDLQVGSSVMTGTISGGTTGIPQISIWGNEQSPTHWRLLSSTFTNNTNEELFVEIASDFEQLYFNYYAAHISNAVVSGNIVGFIRGDLWGINIVESFRASHWLKGYRWFANSEVTWNELIDCTGNQLQEVQFTVEVPNNNCDDYDPLSTDYDICLYWWEVMCDLSPADCWEQDIITEYIVTNGRSDGFICEDSQKGNIYTDVYEAEDANHSEQVIHFNVEERIREIMNDELSFFLYPVVFD